MKQKEPPCPELDKIARVQGESRKISEFLDWLRSNGVVFATYVETGNGDDHRLVPAGVSFEKLLAQYFHIDLNKVEFERRRLLNFIKKGSK